MSTFELMELMASWPTMTRTEHGALVHTHCLLPSGSTINVLVQPAIDGFVVSDNGAALREITSSGLDDEEPLVRSLQRFASQHGLTFRNGHIFSPRVHADEVPAAVILTANTASNAARAIVQGADRKPEREDISDQISAILRSRVPNLILLRSLYLEGVSDRTYSFDNVVVLPSSRKLILDGVAHRQQAISKKTLIHLDIQKRSYPDVQHHLVFDDRENWSNSDLALLRLGADPIALSQTPEYVQRLSAA